MNNKEVTVAAAKILLDRINEAFQWLCWLIVICFTCGGLLFVVYSIKDKPSCPPVLDVQKAYQSGGLR